MIDNRPKLTKTQKETYDAMVRFWSEHGYAPSTQELTSYLQKKSEIGVHALVKHLEEKGYIKSEQKSKRTMIIEGTLPQTRDYVICLPVLENKSDREFLSTDSIVGYYPVPRIYQRINNGYVLLENSYVNHTDINGILICQEQSRFIQDSSMYWVIKYLKQLHLIRTKRAEVIINGEEISIRPFVVAKVCGIIERI